MGSSRSTGSCKSPLSTFYERLAIEHDPDRASDCAKRDAYLRKEMKDVWEKTRSVYGARKLWHAMKRKKIDIARCTVERLMRQLGIQGVRRGKRIKTTHSQPADQCPLDKVNRPFRATQPNELWVSDFTFVSTWRGFVYVAFVVDTFANRIVGWKASTTQDTQFVLDALEQAIHTRRPAEKLIHHSDRGSQYLSIKYTERLADAGIDTSVGSVGDSYDNAMAESIIGLFKTEVINFLGSWKSVGHVEWETLQWVSWYNTERLHGAIGHRPPQDMEDAFYASMNALDNAA